MSWSWIRPEAPAALAQRPLLDLGTGDGQTLAALVESTGLVAGLDPALDSLRFARTRTGFAMVCGDASLIPVRSGMVATVVAGDLLHHLDQQMLAATLAEALRVLCPGGHLLAWWYEQKGRPGPDVPRHPRRYEEVAQETERAGFASVRRLSLHAAVEPSPATTGLVGRA